MIMNHDFSLLISQSTNKDTQHSTFDTLHERTQEELFKFSLSLLSLVRLSLETPNFPSLTTNFFLIALKVCWNLIKINDQSQSLKRCLIWKTQWANWWFFMNLIYTMKQIFIFSTKKSRFSQKRNSNWESDENFPSNTLWSWRHRLSDHALEFCKLLHSAIKSFHLKQWVLCDEIKFFLVKWKIWYENILWYNYHYYDIVENVAIIVKNDGA